MPAAATAPCPKCNDKGYIDVDFDTTAQCVCALARTMKAHLGPGIASAPLITSSPFYAFGPPGEPPTVDLTTKNLLITSYWSDLLPHLRYALFAKGPLYRFQVVSDERLKSVWLGKEAYTSKPKSEREDGESVNGLSDLIGKEYDLAIIRLGGIAYVNRAMPGILLEALLLREGAGLPTWIVETPDKPFAEGNLAYNYDSGEYVERLYQRVAIQRRGGYVPEPEPEPEEDPAQDGADVSPDDGPALPPRKEPPPVRPEDTAVSMPDMDSFDAPKRPRQKFSAGRKSRGGGPV